MKTYGQYIEQVEELGNQLNTDIFLNYYYEHILYNEVISKPTPQSFFISLFDNSVEKESEYQMEIFKKLGSDKKLDEIQDNLEKVGIQCCMVNMYYLCQYIKFLTRNRFFILLAPQIKDTLSEITELDSITFTNKDGSHTTTSSDKTKKIILDALKAKNNEDEYTAIKLVSWDKIANNEIMQAIFVHELSAFLNSYFPIQRRKNAIVTAEEQELITYFLYLLGLSPAKVTASRFRQLKNIFSKINFSSSVLNFSNVGAIEADFVKYENWKKGRLDFTSENLEMVTIKEGDTIQFSKDFKIDISQ